jgi:signal transduction histidine kinase
MTTAVNAISIERVRHSHTSSSAVAVLAVAGVALLALLDASTALPPEFGLLLCVPILLVSQSAHRQVVLITGAVALAGVLAAICIQWTMGLWAGPPSQPAAGLGPRYITLAALTASVAIALLVQHQRLTALRVRDTAVAAGELNSMLMSLLAHDLRAPLALAEQGFAYVEDCSAGGYPVDRTLVMDMRSRLQRSIRAIEMVLTVARDSDASAGSVTMLRCVDLAREIEEEVASFAYEARTRGKALETELAAIAGERRAVNVLVLRQALCIPLDNAVRYTVPGSIRISAKLVGTCLELRVADDGPGLSAHKLGGARSDGSGIGLPLCAALLARCGGAIRVERDEADGTTVVIAVPALPDGPA